MNTLAVVDGDYWWRPIQYEYRLDYLRICVPPRSHYAIKMVSRFRFFQVFLFRFPASPSLLLHLLCGDLGCISFRVNGNVRFVYEQMTQRHHRVCERAFPTNGWQSRIQSCTTVTWLLDLTFPLFSLFKITHEYDYIIREANCLCKVNTGCSNLNCLFFFFPLSLSVFLCRLQWRECLEIVRTGEKDTTDWAVQMLCSFCIERRTNGATVAAKSWTRWRQSCYLGKYFMKMTTI